jgi:hypothetical protein
MRNIIRGAFWPPYFPSLGSASIAGKRIIVSVIAATALFASPAGAVTFDISTLNGVQFGSGTHSSPYYYNWYTGTGGTGAKIFGQTSAAQLDTQYNPWTLGLNTPQQASINFFAPTYGNQPGQLYLRASAGSAPNPFPLPTGQTIGTYNTANAAFGTYGFNTTSFPLYFVFSNPTYDMPCFGGSNCTITPVGVTLNSLYVESTTNVGYTILGADANRNLIAGDVYQNTATSTATTTSPLNWSGVSYVYIVTDTAGSCFDGYACLGANFLVNDIQVNEPVSAVPELSTWMMMVVGFGAVGLAAYRRRSGPAFRLA